MTLKTNSKKVLDIIAAQPKRNASAAYKQIHPAASDLTARNNASQLLKKPEAIIYLQAHTDKAISTVVELMDKGKDNVRLAAAQDVLDRTHGKAKQTTEVTSTSVAFSIDLTGGDAALAADTIEQ